VEKKTASQHSGALKRTPSRPFLNPTTEPPIVRKIMAPSGRGGTPAPFSPLPMRRGCYPGGGVARDPPPSGGARGPPSARSRTSTGQLNVAAAAAAPFAGFAAEVGGGPPVENSDPWGNYQPSRVNKKGAG